MAVCRVLLAVWLLLRVPRVLLARLRLSVRIRLRRRPRRVRRLLAVWLWRRLLGVRRRRRLLGVRVADRFGGWRSRLWGCRLLAIGGCRTWRYRTWRYRSRGYRSRRCRNGRGGVGPDRCGRVVEDGSLVLVLDLVIVRFGLLFPVAGWLAHALSPVSPGPILSPWLTRYQGSGPSAAESMVTRYRFLRR